MTRLQTPALKHTRPVSLPPASCQPQDAIWTDAASAESLEAHDLQRRPSTITPPSLPMATFDKHQLPLPLNTLLSHPSMSTHTNRISNHHENNTWRLLHSLLQLPPNAQRQNRRLPPNVHLHLMNLWKPTTSKKERRRKQEFRIPKPDNATPTIHPL